MNWFLDVIKNKYAQFDGRARRQEYWMYYLVFMIIYVALAIVAAILGAISSTLGSIVYGLIGLGYLAVLIPSLALTVRRLHDIGKSGWMVLLGLIPLVGAIILLVFACTDSQPGNNEYGANPKGL